MSPTTTTNTTGNNFGFLCPVCERGDGLEVSARHWVLLVPDGTDFAEDSSEEWSDDSAVKCHCGWVGQVKQLAYETER